MKIRSGFVSNSSSSSFIIDCDCVENMTDRQKATLKAIGFEYLTVPEICLQEFDDENYAQFCTGKYDPAKERTPDDEYYIYGHYGTILDKCRVLNKKTYYLPLGDITVFDEENTPEDCWWDVGLEDIELSNKYHLASNFCHDNNIRHSNFC